MAEEWLELYRRPRVDSRTFGGRRRPQGPHRWPHRVAAGAAVEPQRDCWETERLK